MLTHAKLLTGVIQQVDPDLGKGAGSGQIKLCIPVMSYVFKEQSKVIYLFAMLKFIFKNYILNYIHVII